MHRNTSIPTGNEIRVDIHQMGGQASSPGGDGGPVSAFEWIGAAVKGVGSACFHTLTGPAAGPLIFAGICAALAYRTKRRAKKLPVLQRSVSIAALHSADMALERILDAQEARVDTEALNSAAAEMRKMLGKPPTEISYRELHRLAAKLEMSGREDEAIKMLQEEVQKAMKNNQPHEAYELEMLLVEMLIYKGEYRKALQCKCLKEQLISDARRPLFQAIICYMDPQSAPLDHKSARDYYEEFQEIRGRFHAFDRVAGTPPCGVAHDFDKFKCAAENLKKEIDHAQKALIK